MSVRLLEVLVFHPDHDPLCDQHPLNRVEAPASLAEEMVSCTCSVIRMARANERRMVSDSVVAALSVMPQWAELPPQLLDDVVARVNAAVALRGRLMASPAALVGAQR